jgi:hypothetical protein
VRIGLNREGFEVLKELEDFIAGREVRDLEMMGRVA